MNVAQVSITGLISVICADGGFDEALTQKHAIEADCWIDGGRVTKVVAPYGITFTGARCEVRRPDDFDITDLCDLDKVARDIVADREEREEMALELID